MTPILLLEINEVPWRLVDRYAARPEFPHLRAFVEGSHQFTTVAVDTGELSPWVTWPTLHRGMNNERHGIRNLGQDPSTFGGTPVWEDIRRRGGSIGIFGSLQSWPPQDPGQGGFYVPDTFAHDASCIPETIAPLQAFNLEQVRRNGRVVSSSTPRIGESLAFLRDCLRAGVRPTTLARLAWQVLSERFDRSRVARRPVYQTVLFWDVFRRQFDPRNPPAFSTFFTNHVASVMHRYWKDVFPEDFPGEASRDRSHEPLMRFALSVLDDILRDALAWSRANPKLVVVAAASMGQGAIKWNAHEGVELGVADVERLVAATGLAREEFQPLLAMMPQVAVRIADAGRRAHARELLHAARFEGGKQFVRVQETGDTLSITVHTPALADMASGRIAIGGRVLALEEAGLVKHTVDPGTAYHVPEGIFVVHAPAAPGARIAERPRVKADSIKQWLLDVSDAGPARVPALAQEAFA